MIKNLTCIECPKGCRLTIKINDNGQLEVADNNCEKGERYAQSEIENPLRLLTSSVLTKGLTLKMVPVRTDEPIPKARVFEAMDAIKKIRLAKRMKAGESIVKDFLGLDGVNLISTRDVT